MSWPTIRRSRASCWQTEAMMLIAYAKKMEARNVLTQIPMRKSRKMRVGVDHWLCSFRNLVERCFNKLKNARRVATRYDKTAESFLGFIDITSIRLWLHHLST